MTKDECLPLNVRRQMEQNRQLSNFRKEIERIDWPRTSLDEPAKTAGLAILLTLPELASFFEGPRGTVVHIPVHISDREGGRTSILNLKSGQSVVAGIYVQGNRVYQRHVKRVSGNAALSVGDRLVETLISRDGNAVQELTYVAKVIDRDTGFAHFANSAASDHYEDGDIIYGGHFNCYSCNADSTWWCGYPCVPLDVDIPA